MRNFKIIIFIAVLFIACKKPYNPGVINAPNTYLIVEGVININGTTTIRLSHTVNLSSKITNNPVTDAQVSVESNANDSFALTSNDSGYYYLKGKTLDITRQYRVRIKTSDNKQYLSDFEQAKVTPPIDSIGYTVVGGNKLQIYANSHDPQNNTHYYRFDYGETWKFHSEYYSNYISNGTAIVPRTADQDIYTCFTRDSSSTIVLGSTAKLTQDVLYQNPITQIESTSEKIEDRYSILVNEYALTADAYTFWSNLKKNTEQLGSIFDAQPSQISGNIHNISDPAEIVVGYISVSTVQSKRIFIDKAQLSDDWLAVYPYACGIDSAWYDHPKSHMNDVQALLLGPNPTYLPTVAFYLPGTPTPAGYLASDEDCVDCTIRGFKVQPSYWK